MVPEMTLEDTVEKYFVKRVEDDLCGIALKGDIPGRRFLDRIAILPTGITVYVELKRPRGGRYSVHQRETLKRLEALGHRIARINHQVLVDAWVAEMKALIGTREDRLK